MHRRTMLFGPFGAGALLLSGPPVARAAAPVDGTHFTALREARPSATPGKIEVLEFFSYACPACNAFDPLLEQWAAALPPDVAFRRVPVPFLYNAETFQRTFFAIQAQPSALAAHRRMFEAVHAEKRRLDKLEDVAEVLAKAGVGREAFLSAARGFSMPPFLARAKSLTESYQVESIPTLAIGGRFLTSPAKAGGAPQALATADVLIQRCRGAGKA